MIGLCDEVLVTSLDPTSHDGIKLLHLCKARHSPDRSFSIVPPSPESIQFGKQL
jgi:hypothetical protein